MLANSRGFVGAYRTTGLSLSVVARGRAGGRDAARLLVHDGSRRQRPARARGGGTDRRAADAGAPGRPARRDLRGPGGLRSRDGRGSPRQPVLGLVGLRRLPQLDLPQGPPRPADRLAARHARRRRAPPAWPRLASLRRRGAADAAQRAGRTRRPAPLPVRQLRGAQDRGRLDRQRAARRRRRSDGGHRQPVPRAGCDRRPRRSWPA